MHSPLSYPEIQLMDSRAVIKFNSIFPKYLQAKDLRIGEVDNFSLLGRLNHHWKLYRRIPRDLSDSERTALVDFATKHGLNSFTLKGATMSVSLPDEFSSFIDSINAILGCRVSPVILQSNGDIYICIEFEMTQSSIVSKVIMDYLRSKHEMDVNLIFYGKHTGKLPYIFNIYQKLGNSLERLTLVETRWDFNNSNIGVENEGLFLNHGILIPKQFSDSARENIIMRLDSPEVKGSVETLHVPGTSQIVEANLKSSFFNDFFLNVIIEYSGPIFYAAKCDGTGLTNCYIVVTDAKDSFLLGIFKHWSLKGRHEHVNFLKQVRDFNSIDSDDPVNDVIQI
ncbi:MAG: hypothetical protein M1327_00355 [Candidatus Thermoplasmatota archaeon]|nr:hypothetical protein [Candidatus Thermoplasmatota archaeon]